MNPKLPLLLDLSQRPCLVIGHGDKISYYVDLLNKYGADVTVVLTQGDVALEAALKQHDVRVTALPCDINELVPAVMTVCVGEVTPMMEDLVNRCRSQQHAVFVEGHPELSTVNLMPSGSEELAKVGYFKGATLSPGEVALVGSGPGDPELLTMRAVNLLQQAEVVVYDRLVSEQILELIPAGTERIYVGKKCDKHTLPQIDINQLLVEQAKLGRRVVRLKGGDPFIFGRGGEEVDDLLADNIPCQVVPGITAASGCTTYAGIPLTHRDYTHGCTFITGHLKHDTLDLPWRSLVEQNNTLVFYMGLKSIKTITRELMAHGMAGDMPAALIEQGTTVNQKVHTANIEDLTELVENTKISTPTLIVIGKVVNVYHNMDEAQRKLITTHQPHPDTLLARA